MCQGKGKEKEERVYMKHMSREGERGERNCNKNIIFISSYYLSFSIGYGPHTLNLTN